MPGSCSFLFLISCVCCMWSASSHGVQKRASNAGEMELQALTRHPGWVLGTELRSSTGAVSSPSRRLISPVHQALVLLCRWSYLVILTICARAMVTSSFADKGSEGWEAVCLRSHKVKACSWEASTHFEVSSCRCFQSSRTYRGAYVPWCEN